MAFHLSGSVQCLGTWVDGRCSDEVGGGWQRALQHQIGSGGWWWAGGAPTYGHNCPTKDDKRHSSCAPLLQKTPCAPRNATKRAGKIGSAFTTKWLLWGTSMGMWGITLSTAHRFGKWSNESHVPSCEMHHQVGGVGPRTVVSRTKKCFCVCSRTRNCGKAREKMCQTGRFGKSHNTRQCRCVTFNAFGTFDNNDTVQCNVDSYPHDRPSPPCPSGGAWTAFTSSTPQPIRHTMYMANVFSNPGPYLPSTKNTTHWVSSMEQ